MKADHTYTVIFADNDTQEDIGDTKVVVISNKVANFARESEDIDLDNDKGMENLVDAIAKGEVEGTVLSIARLVSLWECIKNDSDWADIKIMADSVRMTPEELD